MSHGAPHSRSIRLSAALTFALPALAHAVRIDEHIVANERMAISTVGPLAATIAPAPALPCPPHILLVCNRLKMRRIDARSNRTPMIETQSRRYWAVRNFV